MTVLAKGPRLSREGWVPADPPRVRKSKMLIPKTNSAGAPYGVNPDAAVAHAITEVTPDEKFALRVIANYADLHEGVGGTMMLVIPALPELMDVLATIDTEMEDLEDGGDYERTDPTPEGGSIWGRSPQGEPPDPSDDEPGHDREREDLVI